MKRNVSFWIKLSALACAGALLAGCSASTETTTPSTNTLNAAATAVLGVKGKISSSQLLNSASSSASSSIVVFAASDWTAAHLDAASDGDCGSMDLSC